MNLSLLMVLFVIYSVIGWCIEVVYTYIREKNWVNRGFLIGPYCPIYGYGCLLIFLCLDKYKDDLIVLFLMSVILCSVLEYITSSLMERIFKARWWDYSDRKYNINGRICLETLIPFGILGSVFTLFVNPFITGLLLKIPSTILTVIAIILLIIYVLDTIISYTIITKLHLSTRKIVMDNTEEIKEKVKEKVKEYMKEHSKFGKRLIKSFPDFDIKIERIKRKKKTSHR